MIGYMVIGLTAVLLCGLVYVLLSRTEKHAGRWAAAETGQSGGRRDIRPPLDSADRTIASASVSPPAFSEKSPDHKHAWLKNGMALTFAGEEKTSETAGKLPAIDDVRDDIRRDVLSHIGDLKNIDVFHRLQKIFGNSEASVKEISKIVMGNPILSAKILRVANSPYYGMQQKLNSISHAIMIIGMINLRTIVCQESVLRALNENHLRDNQVMQAVWKHANFTSIYAFSLDYLVGGLNRGTLFTLGLLHDIGKIIMMKLTPLPSNGTEPVRPYSQDWTVEEENTVYGINHALVGRLAFQHWGLSDQMTDVVTFHHAPAHLQPADLGMDRETLFYLLVLFLSDQAARLFSAGQDGNVRTDRLLKPYHEWIDQNKLLHLVADESLLSQLREAETIAGDYA